MEMGRPDFQTLVDAHYAALFRFAMSLTRSESDAADLTQQTFFVWASKGGQLRDASKVKCWLFTTLHRQFLEIRRHSGRFQMVPLEGAMSDLPAVPANNASAIDGQAALRALHELDEIHRAPLALFYLEHLSYGEISAVLAIPIGTVMSRLARGKEHLRRALEVVKQADESKIVPMPRRTNSLPRPS